MSHGHALVVPIAEVDHWVDLDPELSQHLFAVAHHISKAQQAAFSPERVGLIIAGYEVPHTHIMCFRQMRCRISRSLMPPRVSTAKTLKAPQQQSIDSLSQRVTTLE